MITFFKLIPAFRFEQDQAMYPLILEPLDQIVHYEKEHVVSFSEKKQKWFGANLFGTHHCLLYAQIFALNITIKMQKSEISLSCLLRFDQILRKLEYWSKEISWTSNFLSTSHLNEKLWSIQQACYKFRREFKQACLSYRHKIQPRIYMFIDSLSRKIIPCDIIYDCPSIYKIVNLVLDFITYFKIPSLTISCFGREKLL